MTKHTFPKIIAFGDSLTYGYPFGTKYSWVEFLAENTETIILNRGENGDSFHDLLRRVGPDVFDEKPDLVFLLAGTNDIIQNPIQLTQERFKKVVDYFQRHQCELMYLHPPLIQDPTLKNTQKEFHLFTKSFCRKQKISFFSFYEFFLNIKGKNLKSYYEDPIHPSLKGYKKMAEALSPKLQKWINQKMKAA